jgi:uncharacterized membrane protein YoaK (UPF0700 family)
VVKKLILAIFWALVGDFVVLAVNFIPAVGKWSLTLGVFIPIIVFALFIFLGIALLVLASRIKETGLLKKFLILTGAVPISIPISFIFLEAAPEMVANCIFFITMIAFVVGIGGSIVLVYRFGSKQETSRKLRS